MLARKMSVNQQPDPQQPKPRRTSDQSLVSTLKEVSLKSLELFARIYGFEAVIRRRLAPNDVDERITKLAAVQADLEAAVEAVKSLRDSADKSKSDVEQLRILVLQIQEDKQMAEEMIKMPEEAVARVMHRASAKGRGRGLIEGIAIGFLTGLGSSLLASYLGS